MCENIAVRPWFMRFHITTEFKQPIAAVVYVCCVFGRHLGFLTINLDPSSLLTTF